MDLQFQRLSHFSIIGILVVSFGVALASDPSPLQDFCVADYKSPVLVNGFACKDPKLVEANDFFFSGLNAPSNISDPLGLNVNRITADLLPGLNTMAVSMTRADYLPGGLNPPHFHPRGTEMVTVLEGTLLVGFITSSPENRLISKVLHKGDVFVFPERLIHFQHNIGECHAAAISAFSGQTPGITFIANTIFGSHPGIPSNILAKAFRVDQKVIAEMQSKF